MAVNGWQQISPVSIARTNFELKRQETVPARPQKRCCSSLLMILIAPITIKSNLLIDRRRGTSEKNESEKAGFIRLQKLPAMSATRNSTTPAHRNVLKKWARVLGKVSAIPLPWIIPQTPVNPEGDDPPGRPNSGNSSGESRAKKPSRVRPPIEMAVDVFGGIAADRDKMGVAIGKTF
jgi:hypothetical protein